MFGTQVRVLFCENCGAPLETAVAGGSVPCSFCKATNAVRARLDRFFPTENRGSEADRLARLRMQDAAPSHPPRVLLPLMAGSTIADHKLAEAFDLFQATRREVKATQSPDASERLYWLAAVAANTLGVRQDFARTRAVLETALDVVVLERHHHCLRAMLSRNAVREGDIASAEQWLAGCDPRPESLESDSNYRVSRALIDTTRGEFAAVLTTLGRTNDEIPIHDSLDVIATALRANAFEKTGDVETAVRLLQDRMARTNAAGREAIEKFVAVYAPLQICSASLPRASAQHAAFAAQAANRAAGGDAGKVLLATFLTTVLGKFAITGVLLLVGLAVSGGVAWFALGSSRGGSGLMFASATSLFSCGIVGLTTLVPLAIVGAVAWHFISRGREAAYLRQHGIPAQGTVQSIRPTGTRINGVPEVEVEVMYAGANGPQRAKAKMLLQFGQMTQIGPGANVSLRVDPKNPEKVLIET